MASSSRSMCYDSSNIMDVLSTLRDCSMGFEPGLFVGKVLTCALFGASKTCKVKAKKKENITSTVQYVD